MEGREPGIIFRELLAGVSGYIVHGGGKGAHRGRCPDSSQQAPSGPTQAGHIVTSLTSLSLQSYMLTK